MPRSIVKGFILFAYLCDCSVKTELIGKSNYAKNSLNRLLVGCIVYRQFSMSFAFELTSGHWARSAENWTSALSEFQEHPSAILSHTPCVLSSLIQYHFFSEPGPINDHCLFPNLFGKRETRLAFAKLMQDSNLSQMCG